MKNEKTLTQQISLLNKKRTRDFKFSNLTSSQIKKIGSFAETLNGKSLSEIKKSIAENKSLKGIKNSNLNNVIQTILNCKQTEKKIILNTSFFSEPLKLYLPMSGLSTKCLTNDYLYLEMLYKKYLYVSDIDDRKKELIREADLDDVFVISENFQVDDETQKGLIQDYDDTFSLICSLENRDVYNWDDFIIKKEKKFDFDFDFNEKYSSFGNDDVCVICRDNLSNEEIKENIISAKYLKNDKGVFTEGERKVRVDGKVRFINKKIQPETFCPSYWFGPRLIRCNFLFVFKLDYNKLFDWIVDKKINDGVLEIPENICYWDSLQQCFDFLAVLALTAEALNDDRERIFKWYDDYNSLKKIIVYWRDNQLRLQRIFNDFLNCFLNNSEYSRFVNLYNKCEKCFSVYNKLKSLNMSKEMIIFFNNLPFTRMIKNQLSDDVYGILVRVRNVLRNYINGNNYNTILADVRSVAQSIYNLLPNDSIDGAAFPFICAGGGIAGDFVAYNDINLDGLLENINRNYRNIRSRQRRSRSEINNAIDLALDIDNKIQEYLKKYLDNKAKKDKFLTGLNIDHIINGIMQYININTNKRIKMDLYNSALSDILGKRRNDLINDAIRELKSIRGGRGTKIKLKVLEPLFSNMKQDMRRRRYKDIINKEDDEDDKEEEEESEDEDKKSNKSSP